MVKNLRSFVHEKFPLELRVDIDLLARRRDIRNAEKQEELLKLLRKYELTNISQLGPGTNRYAIKTDGFVVKFATDGDGRIDNQKEFKMSKRLYPHVPKTYEVAENGTILIAEYIAPFDSYTEMLKYADQIKEILKEWSAVYLIGDVGITSKNYANWGLRIGTNEVVCLDFAYVYDASSSIFICRHCNTNSMLVPTKDYTKLVCPNPACGKETLFEDIRAMIPNEYHKQQIGDLTEEGYPMTTSSALTELVESRSNYLVRQRKDKNKKIKTKFAAEQSLETEANVDSQLIKIEKEDIKMNGKILMGRAEAVANQLNQNTSPKFGKLVLQGVAVNLEEYQKPMPETPRVDPEPEKPESDGVVFGGAINPKPIIAGKVVSGRIDETSKADEAPTEQPATTNENAKSLVENNNDADDKEPLFLESFINNSNKAVSILSNRIGEELRERDVFAVIKGYLKDKKMYPETFYKSLQSAIFRSLVSFMEFEEMEIPNNNNNGTHREFRAVAEKVNDRTKPYIPTLIFIERCFNIRRINSIEDNQKMLAAYRKQFQDVTGLQYAWLEVFQERLLSKLQIIPSGASLLAQYISEVWCGPNEFDEVITDEEEVVEVVSEEVPTKNDESEDYDEAVEQEADDVNTTETEENLEEAAAIAQDLPDITGSYEIEDNPDDTTDEEMPSETQYLTVEIYPEDDFDIVRIICSDYFGIINIPFYVDLNAIDPATYELPPSVVDDRNGDWDWLIHLVPDLMFHTTNPDYYLELNRDYHEQGVTHFVIMDVNDGVYTIGCYYLEGIYVVDDDGNYDLNLDHDLLFRINAIVKSDIGFGSISHLKRSLGMPSLIHDEDYVLSVINASGDVDDEESGEEEPMSEAEEAALAAVLATPGPTVVEEVEAEEVESIGSDPEEESVSTEPPAKEANKQPRDENGRFVKRSTVAETPVADEPASKTSTEAKPDTTSQGESSGTLRPVRRKDKKQE